MPKLVETQQSGAMAKRQNHNATVSSWDRELLDLCCDIELFILNGQTPNDESGEFICLANGGRNTINYIIGSPIVWQATTHLEVIIDDTRYYVVRGDSDHRPLRLRLSIDCSFVELQHTIETKILA